MRLSIACLCLALFASITLAQSKKAKPPAAEDADAEAAQQRTVAISLVSSLADEARSFKDQTRRARVQARAADVAPTTGSTGSGSSGSASRAIVVIPHHPSPGRSQHGRRGARTRR